MAKYVNALAFTALKEIEVENTHTHTHVLAVNASSWPELLCLLAILNLALRSGWSHT